MCVVVAFLYARSRFGRLLRATREDDAAARAVGASVYRQRLAAFTVSGLLAGLAGGKMLNVPHPKFVEDVDDAVVEPVDKTERQAVTRIVRLIENCTGAGAKHCERPDFL